MADSGDSGDTSDTSDSREDDYDYNNDEYLVGAWSMAVLLGQPFEYYYYYYVCHQPVIARSLYTYTSIYSLTSTGFPFSDRPNRTLSFFTHSFLTTAALSNRRPTLYGG